ncbi:hypothetical protein NPIL_346031 [Nephila pilipes]|uniref:Uncharacterized protein n=1 Tax=Nephila pilipes TaxID=299642 RepID=A0A8X6Q8H0_NEPPI|nr:hypothetical protein NPIL_346031 [Nephila pilipes]
MKKASITGDRSFFILNHSLPTAWTRLSLKSNGMIDRLKLREVLFNLKFLLRFQMACIYKLEEDAKKFWNEMDPNIKKYHFRNFVCDSKKVWMNIGEWARYFESGIEKWSRHSFSHPLSCYSRDGAAL